MDARNGSPRLRRMDPSRIPATNAYAASCKVVEVAARMVPWSSAVSASRRQDFAAPRVGNGLRMRLRSRLDQTAAWKVGLQLQCPPSRLWQDFEWRAEIPPARVALRSLTAKPIPPSGTRTWPILH